MIRDWWTECCGTTWREDLADADRRATALDDLANRLHLRLALLHAQIRCLTAAVGVLRTAIEELWRWSTVDPDPEDPTAEDARAYAHRVCLQALSDPVVERTRLLREPLPEDLIAGGLLADLREVIESVQSLGNYTLGCPAASHTSRSTACSEPCRRARALLKILGELTAPVPRR